MLRAEGKKIIMDEGDYGIKLPFKISGDVLETDKFLFVIKKDHNKDEIIRKEYDLIKEEDNKFCFDLSFTKENSKLLTPGYYVYLIRQCRYHEVHNTVERDGEFEVREGLEL